MSSRSVLRLALAALTVAVASLGVAGDSTCVLAQQSTSCRSACLAQYNQCRVSSKGAPACDAKYQACLQGCLSGR